MKTSRQLYSLLYNSSEISYILSLTLAVLAITWVWSTLRFWATLERSTTPLLIPYTIPYLGHMFNLAWNPIEFTIEALRCHGWARPLRVKIGPELVTMLGNPVHINQAFQLSLQLTNKLGIVFAFKHVFGTPSECLSVYADDDSGLSAKPRKGSTIGEENRIHRHHYHFSQTYLTAQHLPSLSERFIITLTRNLHTSKLFDSDKTGENAWFRFPDLYSFLRRHVTASFTRCLPRWLYPGAYKNRDKLLEMLKQWHIHGDSHSCYYDIRPGDPEWEPCFGAKTTKAKHSYIGKINLLNAEARAAEDLATLYAMNANTNASIFWFVFEALKDAHLLGRLRKEIGACLHVGQKPPSFDIAKLSSQPLLQSVFAETLRLRVVTGFVRVSEHAPLELEGYTIEQNHRFLVFTHPLALSTDAWMSAGRPPTRPLTEFQAERFLIIATVALLFHNFDIELSPGVNIDNIILQYRWISTGGGVPPSGKVPFRMRKRTE
ncbi:cytochrome P450 [Xylaria curta]|nr:cytochrome P450 [Xylaria curta]